MPASMKRNLGWISAALILATVSIGDAQAAQLSKTKYVSLWTSACMAGGKSQSLKITSMEAIEMDSAKTVVAAYRAAAVPLGLKPRPLSELLHKQCGCMANYIVGRK